MKFAAIDIGSNAVRLLICNVNHINGKPIYKKELLVRAPVRLGEQAFLDGVIHENKVQLLSKSIMAFRNLMEIYQVDFHKAFATSAMRNASNGPEIVERIKQETGIQIDKIDGKKEAITIFENYRNNISDHPKESTFLSIDVGGGSTEMILFNQEKIIDYQSFKIGTLRVKNFLVEEDNWVAMRKWLTGLQDNYSPEVGFGSGGNIIKIHKIYFEGLYENPITLPELKEAKTHLSSFSLRERIQQMSLKPDRADVIIPASEIFINVMHWAGIEKLFIPKLGLSDGIIRLVYEEYQKNQAAKSKEAQEEREDISASSVS